jgi:uncharacterized membrane protein HdeD (DUF308 family)
VVQRQSSNPGGRKIESTSDRITKLAGTQVRKWRWALGLNGLASVVFGVLILAWSEISVYALTIVFGAYALATGITAIAAAFSSRAKDERGSLVLSGLLGMLVGAVVLAWPGISALAPLYIIGLYAVLLGITAVVASLRLPQDGRDTALMILNRLVSIVFGIAIFAKPGAGALAVLALIAAFALVSGVSELLVAISGKEMLERKAKQKFGPKSTPQPSH